MQIIRFTLDGHFYALELEYVESIELKRSIVAIPNAPGCIKGIVDIHGEFVPVYSLRKRFQYEDKLEEDSSRLLVVEIENMAVALEVDEVIEIIELKDKKGIDLISPDSEAKEYELGSYQMAGKTVTILNMMQLIPEEERRQLPEIEQW